MSRRELAANLVCASGIPWLVRRVLARRRATILLYHDPAPEVIQRHLAWLKDRYHFVRLEEIVEALQSGDWDALPERSLAVTFDDGHARNAELRPVFERYGVRPLIYACSQIVGTGRRFWFDECGDDDGPLMHLPNRQRLERLRTDHDFDPEREYDGPAAGLSNADLDTLLTWADVGSHTRFHPILTACDDRECEEEIARSREEIEQRLGVPCLHIAYPNGDYGAREIEIARRAGYLSGRTTDVGWTQPGSDPFRLRITGAADDASLKVLEAQLSGVTMYLRYLLRGSLTGSSPKTPVSG